MNVLKKTGALALVLTLAVCFCAMASATALGTSTTTGSDITVLTFSSTLSAGVHLAGNATYAIGTASPISPASGTAPTVSFTENVNSVAITAGASGNNGSVSLALNANGASDGLFEFPITQTLDAAFVANDNPTELYLSVVVTDGKVTQAVLHTVSGGTGANGGYTVTTKVAGFEYAPAPIPSGAVTLTKVLSGTYGSLNKGTFTFAVTISNHNGTYANLPFTIAPGTGVAIDQSSVTGGTISDSGENNAALPNTGTMSFNVTVDTSQDSYGGLGITGLPADMQVTFQETERGVATSTTLKVGDAPAEFTSETGENAFSYAYTIVENGNGDVEFTNVFESISMTGVSLRYAPYLLTLGAGLVVLPMTKTYRRREDY